MKLILQYIYGEKTLKFFKLILQYLVASKRAVVLRWKTHFLHLGSGWIRIVTLLMTPSVPARDERAQTRCVS